jgi:RHS repeat-associated protein
VRDIANASGSSVYHTGYDAFGAKVSESGAGADRWGFTGREHDTDTGLRYHRARYVDLVLGRWMSNDPIGFDAGDVNLYRYVRNSPTAFTDPLGQQVYIVPSAPWGLHMNIVAYAPNTGATQVYGGGGPGAVGSGQQVPYLAGPAPITTERPGWTPPFNAIPVSSAYESYQEEVAALNDAYEHLNQVPVYQAETGPNSNTYAHQLLINAGFKIPDWRRPIRPPGLHLSPNQWAPYGWNYDGPYKYDGPLFDENGKPKWPWHGRPIPPNGIIHNTYRIYVKDQQGYSHLIYYTPGEPNYTIFHTHSKSDGVHTPK